jgi:hypothetical protein
LITHIAPGTTLVWKKFEILEGGKDKAITEVAIAKQINSPYVVSILDYLVDDETLYIVMEFFKNGTLANLLKRLQKSRKIIEEKGCFSVLSLSLFFLLIPLFVEISFVFLVFFQKFLHILVQLRKGGFVLFMDKRVLKERLKE